MANRKTFSSPIGRRLAFGAIAAAALMPTALSAQIVAGARGSGQTNYHLVQLSVDTAKVTQEEFSTRTQSIASCNDAMDVAREFDADIRRNRFVMAQRLPVSVKDALRDLPTGQASQIFSADGETMRVLVICNRI